MSNLEKKTCPVCGKLVAVRVPKGGNGTTARPVPHNGKIGLPCDGRLFDIDL